MENNNIDTQSSARPNTFTGVILRFVTSAVILAITAFFTPGFTISNVWSLALAAVVLYVTQYFVVGYSISWIAAIIGALIYGVVDYFVPDQQ